MTAITALSSRTPPPAFELGNPRRREDRVSALAVTVRDAEAALTEVRCHDVHGFVVLHYGDLGRSRARSHVADQLWRDASLFAGLMAMHSA